MCRVCVHMESQSRKLLESANGDQKEDELLLDTDKLLVALYIALGCLDG